MCAEAWVSARVYKTQMCGVRKKLGRRTCRGKVSTRLPTLKSHKDGTSSRDSIKGRFIKFRRGILGLVANLPLETQLLASMVTASLHLDSLPQELQYMVNVLHRQAGR